MYVIVYNSTDNKTISRLCRTRPSAEFETNGYGWEIVTIQEVYEQRVYTIETILKLIEEDREKREKWNWRINKFISILDTLINA